MKILRLTPHYYFESKSWPGRFDPLGGMQVQISLLSQWLSEHNTEQDILTTGFPRIPRVISINKKLNVYSVRLLTLPFKSKHTGTVFLDESWSFGAVKWMLKNKRVKYDAIHVHASGVVWPLLVLLFATKIYKNIPIVLTIHCSRYFTYKPMSFFDCLIHKFVKKIEKKAIFKSKKVILLTDVMVQKYKQLIPNCENKFQSISDCIAPYHLIHKEGKCCNELFDKFPILKNKDILLYVGRIAHEKGWPAFIKIAENLKYRKNIFFLVCGDGPQKIEMENRIRDLGLENNFLLTGFISHQKIPCVMSISKALIMPSLHEELGGTALEGVIAEVPVVASAVGGLKTLFVNNKTAFLLNPADIDGFVNAIEKLLEDKLLRNSIVKKAKEEIQKNFSPENVLNKYVSIYSKLYVLTDD